MRWSIITIGLRRTRRDEWNDDIAAVYEAATYALLKNQDQADALIKGFDLQTGKHRWPQEEVDYDDDLGRAAQYIYLLSHEFPERLKKLTQDDPVDAGLTRSSTRTTTRSPRRRRSWRWMPMATR